ncbi:MAG: hypothetical protein JKY99_00690, partial [Rhizobiales bacterium]|nr:hypothetical protein [Hyphomicrobiales bacterium]
YNVTGQGAQIVGFDDAQQMASYIDQEQAQAVANGAQDNTGQIANNDPAQNYDPNAGPVDVIITNNAFDNMAIVAVDDPENPTFLAELARREAYIQPAYPGNELAFSVGEDAWFDTNHIVTNEAGQVILFEEDGTLSVFLDDGRFRTFVEEQALAAQKPQAGPDEVAIGFINHSRFLLLASIMPENNDEAPEGLFELPSGITDTHPVPKGARIGFFNAEEGSYLGEFYTVPNTVGKGEIVSVPYLDTSLVTVTAINNTSFNITVLEASNDPQAAPSDLLKIPPNGAERIRIKPGKKLQFYDYDNATFDGDDYVVTESLFQQLSIPVRPPGTVLISIYNPTNKTINASTVSDNPNAEGEFVGSCGPGKTMRTYRRPGENIGFGHENATDWLGGFYTVSAKASQHITLPLKRGDSDGDGIVSQAEISAIASKIAQTIAARQIEIMNQPSRCWRNSYGRGVGIIPDTCPSGYPNLEAGLCYASCPTGFTGFAATCVRDCPSNYTSDGLFSCYKPKPHTRHTEIWELGDTLFSLDDARARCAKSSLGRRYGCSTENSDTIVYSKCPPNTKRSPVITNLCFSICPSSMTDLGLSCYKNNEARGVGRIRNSCSASRTSSDGKPKTDNDAGLCYEQCDSGYNGVGPVCWGYCPRGWVNCGAGCAQDSNQCVMMLSDQISSPLMVAGNVALIAVTAGAATGATVGANAAKAAAKTATAAAIKIAAKTAAKAALRSQVRHAMRIGLSQAAKQGAKAIAKDLAMDSAISAALSTTMANIGSAVQQKQFKDQVRDLVVKELEKGISDEQIDAAIEVAMAGADAEDGILDNFPWESLDPTGIAEVVVAYNMPLCETIID